eukprot:scaffold466850_cov28-Prasinocladus_malaysianus.AAC.1
MSTYREVFDRGCFAALLPLGVRAQLAKLNLTRRHNQVSKLQTDLELLLPEAWRVHSIAKIPARTKGRRFRHKCASHD